LPGGKKVKGYKVYERIKNLKEKGYGKRRAAREAKVSRVTIDKYWDMDEEECAQCVIDSKSRTKILDPYREYIKRQISEYHEITCPIIYDHLREEYP
jgi:hypothetical protein